MMGELRMLLFYLNLFLIEAQGRMLKTVSSLVQVLFYVGVTFSAVKLYVLFEVILPALS